MGSGAVEQEQKTLAWKDLLANAGRQKAGWTVLRMHICLKRKQKNCG